ncbi:hypothetical protein LJR235_002306 [Pararhizobium sp. LjRoot235]|uniref:hypothetical protein n=1 Tax=Pararhizobium sp. LjRoot235 TaxID=3342291 RepID=UPI003ECDB46E
MRSVLGIDAAWTDREPSSGALVADDSSGRRLIDVAASYAAFLREETDAGPIARHRGSVPDAASLIEAANRKLGVPMDVIAIGMPLSKM